MRLQGSSRRAALGLVGAVLGAPLLLAGCFGNRASFRYKLTLSVDTPEGVKTGSSVVEVDAWDVVIPDRGTMSRARGEAVYVDLGVGARPIVAVMVPYRPSGQRFIWGEGKPDIDGLLRLYGEPPKPSEGLIDRIKRLSRLRGPRTLTVNDLPDLVTFADVNVPSSVLRVDPHDLPAALERNVRWHWISIEVTNEPVTRGIEKKLSWLKSWQGGLDGSYSHYLDHRATLANSLNSASFRRGV